MTTALRPLIRENYWTVPSRCIAAILGCSSASSRYRTSSSLPFNASEWRCNLPIRGNQFANLMSFRRIVLDS
jgi:hypothetical protein